jgi:ribosome-binding factor A
MKEGVMGELNPQLLMICSIDNIDILQLCAMVSSIKDRRSWHGTSVQCVQPLQDSLPAECFVESTQQLEPTGEQQLEEEIHGKRARSSPAAMSPAMKQVKKRRRTMTELSHLYTKTQVGGESEVTPDAFADCTAYQRPNIVQYSIRSFQPFPEEDKTLQELRSTIFQYMILKEVKTNEVDMPGLPSFLNGIRYSTSSNESSTIAYLEILSLPADNKATVLKVLKNLHHTFIKTLGHRWLVVVGDAKTYDILQYFRRQYGSQIGWMLPFPGDWHILFNYQKVLLKIYGDAGLLDMAKVAGH